MKCFRRNEGRSGTAEYGIGVLYADGDGVGQNYAAALKWWRKASHLGNAHAMCAIAYLFYRGLGVSANKVKAIRWCDKAAAVGMANEAGVLRNAINNDQHLKNPAGVLHQESNF